MTWIALAKKLASGDTARIHAPWGECAARMLYVRLYCICLGALARTATKEGPIYIASQMSCVRSRARPGQRIHIWKIRAAGTMTVTHYCDVIVMASAWILVRRLALCVLEIRSARLATTDPFVFASQALLSTNMESWSVLLTSESVWVMKNVPRTSHVLMVAAQTLALRMNVAELNVPRTRLAKCWTTKRNASACRTVVRPYPSVYEIMDVRLTWPVSTMSVWIHA